MAEVAFDGLPGRILNARVQSIVPTMGEGQRAPGGDLEQRVLHLRRGRFFLRLNIDSDHPESDHSHIHVAKLHFSAVNQNEKSVMSVVSILEYRVMKNWNKEMGNGVMRKREY